MRATVLCLSEHLFHKINRDYEKCPIICFGIPDY